MAVLRLRLHLTNGHSLHETLMTYESAFMATKHRHRYLEIAFTRGGSCLRPSSFSNDTVSVALAGIQSVLKLF